MEVQGKNPECRSSLLYQASSTPPQASSLYYAGCHEGRQVLHNGVRETFAELRSKFWIIKGRYFVKSVIHQCHLCRRHEGKPYSAPPPPPLLTFRVEEAPQFSFTGVDFAGPLYVRSNGEVRKVWICLYTCCFVRAIHLDLVPDLSTHAFLRSFRHFTARRGLCCRTTGRHFKQQPRPSRTSSRSSMSPRLHGGDASLREWFGPSSVA